MKILITGNNGYIGSILTRMLINKGHRVIGLDTNYYSGCEFYRYSKVEQFTKDIRDVSIKDLEGIDGIIHLAALSNDPLGAFDAKLTDDINYLATIKLAKLAKEVGIRRFVYASSCSMYGISGEEVVAEDSPLSPITEYAISKVKSEAALSKMADKNFSPIFLRASTAYGVSPMLRCDLVVNNLTGWAYTTGEIKIMSDGTPWRPTIHVNDLALAYIACLECPIGLVHNEAFNVGQNEENYQIKDIANVVQSIIPKCEVKYTYEHTDSRTYKVNFDKITNRLKDYFKPEWDITKGIMQLYESFKSHRLTYEEFVGNKYIRLNQLKSLVDSKAIDDKLFWRK